MGNYKKSKTRKERKGGIKGKGKYNNSKKAKQNKYKKKFKQFVTKKKSEQKQAKVKK